MAVGRKTRLLLLILAGVAVLAGGLSATLYLALKHEPAFYQQALEIEPSALEEASDQMLQQTTALAGAMKKPGDWEALFTDLQINGWLAVDMARNHPRVLPPGFSNPRVAIEGRQATIASRFQYGGLTGVLNMVVEPYVPEPNVLALRIVRVRAGMLPLPLEPVLQQITAAAAAAELSLQWRRNGNHPVALIRFSAQDDERHVCLKILRLDDGQIYVAGSTAK